eukprot:scaffold241_cov340-Pavlova_lutheri.AAC.14
MEKDGFWTGSHAGQTGAERCASVGTRAATNPTRTRRTSRGKVDGQRALRSRRERIAEEGSSEADSIECRTFTGAWTRGGWRSDAKDTGLQYAYLETAGFGGKTKVGVKPKLMLVSRGETGPLLMRSEMEEYDPRAQSSGTATEEVCVLPAAMAEHAIAGAVAGGTVEAILYPLDTIKTRLQAATGGWAAARTGVFKGLYQGMGTSVVGSMPSTAIFFATYEWAKRVCLVRLPESLSSVAHLTGAVAGSITASLVRTPAEIIKQRLQCGQYKTPTAAIQGTYRAAGVAGFYRGVVPMLLRDLPFNAVEFVAYEQFKLLYLKLKEQNNAELTPRESAVLGALSGATTGVLTTPLDVVKTRLMLEESALTAGNVVSTLWREGGMSAFFRGVTPRLLWISIGGSIFFTALETTEHALAKHRMAKQKYA